MDVEAARHVTDAGELSITVSVGVASFDSERTWPIATDKVSERYLRILIEQAGEMLRLAKRRGRNQVAVYE